MPYMITVNSECKTSNNEDLFSFKRVSFKINSSFILRNISTSIPFKGITGIIGPSGAGKSTFLRLMNKLITPTEGNIYFKGENYQYINSRQIRKDVGLVQQEANLFSGTVKYNLLYGPKIWGLEYTERQLEELLNKVALDRSFLYREASTLSGGEKQRVNVARSLANDPCALLLDEPTSSLDVSSAEILENTIERLSDSGIKLIIVTHSLEQTKRLTDELIFLKEGNLIERVSTNEFFDKNSEKKIRSFFKKSEEEEEK